jgi:hypothetical protein
MNTYLPYTWHLGTRYAVLRTPYWLYQSEPTLSDYYDLTSNLAKPGKRGKSLVLAETKLS